MADPDIPENENNEDEVVLTLDEEFDDELYASDDNIIEKAEQAPEQTINLEPPQEPEQPKEPDPKTDHEHYHHAMSGADGHISGKIDTSANKREKLEKEEEKKNRGFLLGMMSYEEFMKKLDELGGKLNELKNNLDEEGNKIAETIELVNPRIQEIQGIISTREQELQQLQDNGASPEAIALKQQELENAQKALKLYMCACSKLTDKHQELVDQYKQQKAEYDNLRKVAEEQYKGVKNMPQKEQDRLGQLEKDLAKTQNDLAGLEAGRNYAKHLAEIGEKVNAALGGDDNDKNTVEAQSKLIDKLTKATEDGKLTLEEQQELKALSQKLGVPDVGVQMFASGIKDYEISVETADNKYETGQEAANHLMKTWQQAKETVANENKATSEDLQKTKETQEGAKANLEAGEQEVEGLNAEIKDALNTGTAKEQREAFLGKVTLSSTGKFSYMIETIKDSDGNAVHKDHENNTYYYLDKNNEKVYYDDPEQIAEFERKAVGDFDPKTGEAINDLIKVPGMEYSNFKTNLMPDAQPPMKFANENENTKIYMKSWDKHCACEDVDNMQRELQMINERVKALEETKNMQEADLKALDKLKEDFESKKIDKTEFEKGLEEIEAKYKDKGEVKTAEADKAQDANEQLNLDTPKYTLAQAEQSRNEVLNAFVETKSITQDEYDQLLDKPGMSREELDRMMDENKIEIDDSPQPKQDPNGIYYAGGTAYMGSVLDDYPEHNDPNAEYMRPVANGVSETTPSASAAFSSEPQSGGMTPEEREALALKQQAELNAQMEEKLRQNDPALQGAGGAPMG